MTEKSQHAAVRWIILSQNINDLIDCDNSNNKWMHILMYGRRRCMDDRIRRMSGWAVWREGRIRDERRWAALPLTIYHSLSSFNQRFGIQSYTHTYILLYHQCGVMANCSECVSQLVQSLLLLFQHIKAGIDPWHTHTHTRHWWIEHKSEKFTSSRLVPFCSVISVWLCI